MKTVVSLCRFCRNTMLQEWFCFGRYPIFIGCVDTPQAQDELYDFSVSYCPECKIAQQLDLPPLEILYKEKRAFGIGSVWKEHYNRFFEFLRSVDYLQTESAVLEIGGGNGVVLQKFLESGFTRLSDLEPHPQYSFSSVKTMRRYLDPEFNTTETYDLIYCSHFVEHLSDVGFLFQFARDHLNEGGSLVTACPNIVASLSHMHLNAFTADHFNYFSVESLTGLAERNGLTVTRVEMFRDHGMYLRYEKAGLNSSVADTPKASALQTATLPALYESYERTLTAFVRQVQKLETDRIFLFGAHAFTITFLRYLGATKFTLELLDNEPTKVGRRLCGTSLLSQLPARISDPDVVNPIVVLYMGAYTQEIISQLNSIQPNVRICSLNHFSSSGELFVSP